MWVDRHTDLRVIDDAVIDRGLAQGHLQVIQFSRPGYTPELLTTVDRLCARHGPRVQVRFYAHQSCFDAVALRHLPCVSSLAIDCLDHAVNLSELGTLGKLERLVIGIRHPDRRDLLALPNLHFLRMLGVGPLAKGSYDLSALTDMRDLVELRLAGHSINLDVIAGLASVQELWLSGIPRSVSLAWMARMSALTRLQLHFGGHDDLGDLTHARLESLEMVHVLGLAAFDPAVFPALKRLKIEDQARIPALDFAPTCLLEELIVINCTRLDRVTGIAGLSTLQHLRLSRTAVALDPLIDGGLPATLRVCGLYTGKKKEDARIRARLTSLGLVEFGTKGVPG